MVNILKRNRNHKEKHTVYSPVTGYITDITELSDETFSSEILGRTLAIQPEADTVYAPVTGVIQAVFPTKHAIGIHADEGYDILIHIGIDTVNLKGEGFHTYVKKGDRVSVGDKLTKIDRKLIRAHQYDPVVIMIITNSNDYTEITDLRTGEIHYSEDLLRIL